MMWFKKKPAPPKQKPARIAVHCNNGSTVVHYAIYRTVHKDGRLTLHDRQEGCGVVADYAAGHWMSVTVGKRSIQ